MSRTRTAVVLLAAIALSLTGCSDATDRFDAGNAGSLMTDGSSASSTPETTGLTDDDRTFLAEARLRISTYGELSGLTAATDEELISAGREACRQLDSGTAYYEVRLFPDEQPVQVADSEYELIDNGLVLSAAALNYCTDYVIVSE